MKLSSVALLIITALSLSACGGGEDTKKEPVGDGGQTTPITPNPSTPPETPKDQADGQEPDNPVKPPEQQPISSISEAMDRLVALGAIPKLNRDDDVAGPDVDGNGVRDDLDAYVASLPDSEPQKKAMLQVFSSIQYLITLDTSDEAAIKEGLRLIPASIKCLYKQYGKTTAHNRFKEIETYIINTESRAEAYSSVGVAANGRTMSSPEGDSCVE